MEKKSDYCNNCGNYGHLYKNCRHPILSYGIILYNIENDCSKIVMVERKDSLSYIEFLRGKYTSINDIHYLKLLFSRFSQLELNRLKEKDFDNLWKDLWIHTETINPRIKKEYKKSKYKFNLLKKGFELNGNTINIDYLISSVKNPFTSNEWEIPKGRRKLYETNRECALREFFEETNIDKIDFKLYKNIIPIIEEYKGINGVRYKQVYYIGRVNELLELSINMENKDQSTEIKNIQWLTEEECYQKIRHYDSNKKKVIEKVFQFLSTHSQYVTIK